MEYSRTTARHATVCPRCKGYIAVGTTIVLGERSKQWMHAVCPGFDAPTHGRSMEEIEATSTSTVLKFNANGELI